MKFDSDHYRQFFENASTGIYHALFENSNDAIVIYRYNQILKYNKAAVELFGFPDKDQFFPLDRIFPEFQPDGTPSAEKAKQLIKRVLDGESMLFDWVHKKFNGEEFFSEVSLNRLDVGIEGCFQAIIRDISVHVMHKINEERFHAIFNTAPVGIARTSPEGKILLANYKLAEIFDFDTPESMISSVDSLADDIYHSETARAEILEGLKKNKKHQGTYQIKTQKGNLRTINLKAIASFNNSGRLEWIDSVVEDITEKIELQESLKKRETILSSIINSLPFELWVSDKEGNALCQSAYSKKYWGDVVGKNIDEINLSDKGKKEWKERAQKVLGGELIDTETQVFWEGTEYFFHRLMAPLTDGNEIEGVISLSINITEQKKAVKELRKSEERYRYLMENMNEVVMIVDNNDRVQYVNKKFTEKFGYTPEEIVGKTGYEVLLDPHEHEIIIEANKMRTRKITSQYEIQFKAKDGNKIDFLVSGAPIYGDDGQILGSIGTMADITERKKAEKVIKENEELLRNIIHLAPYPIVLNNNVGRYMMINNAFTKNMGYEPEDIIGKTSEEVGLKFDDDREKVLSQALRETGKVENFDIRTIGKNGKAVDVLYSGKLIQLNNETVLLSSSVDITEKKKIESELKDHKNNLERLVRERTEEIEMLNQELIATNEELFQNNEELNSVNEALASQKKQLEEMVEKLTLTQMQLVQSEKMASIGVLTAGIAHEINNPVNFISSGITGLELVIKDILEVIKEYSAHCEDIKNCRRKDILQEIESKYELQTSVENISKLLQSIHVGVERTTRIVKSLRTFSRLDSEVKTHSDIHELIDSSLTILNNKIKDRIYIEKQYYLTEMVNCYPGKMGQVFMNLLINAIQAVGNEGTITLITRKNKQNNTVEIIVRDTGHGMSKEVQMKIFDPFFTTKPVGEGTGMGMSIVHGIIKDHSGEIFVQSKPGKGTDFLIVLPAN